MEGSAPEHTTIKRGGNHETKRATHRLLADRSRRCHLLQDPALTNGWRWR